jgi:hypothetical protein
VNVDGTFGIWLDGGVHTATFVDEDGELVADRTRLAGNTLIFERSDVTVRLESGLSKEDAIRFAESLAPA